MNILNKMNEIGESFDKVMSAIETKKSEIKELEFEAKKLEGAFLMLRQLAIEEGLLDEEGKVIEVPEAQEETENEVNSNAVESNT